MIRFSKPEHVYPELAAGGYTRHHTGIEFYTRVNGLVPEGGVVLDFGAGRGRLADDPRPALQSQRLQRPNVRVIGLDISEEVEQNPLIDQAIVWRGGPIPLPTDSVDVVVSDWVFEHIENPAFTVAELKRVVRSGGWICARTPNKWGYIGVFGRLVPVRWHSRLVGALQDDRETRDVFPTFYRLNTLKEYRRLFGSETVVVSVDGALAYGFRVPFLAVSYHILARMLPERLKAVHLIYARNA